MIIIIIIIYIITELLHIFQRQCHKFLYTLDPQGCQTHCKSWATYFDSK